MPTDEADRPAKTRRRRPSAEIRPAILKAAHEVFTEKTYSAARTKTIAERANVAENLIFDHFGSKQALFREAILAPVEDFLSSWAETVSTANWGERSAEVELSEYLTALITMLLRERRVLAAYFGSISLDSDALSNTAPQESWREALSRTEELAGQFAGVYGLTFDDIHQNVPLVLASIVGVALFGEFFLGAELQPEEIAQTLARQLLFGVGASGTESE